MPTKQTYFQKTWLDKPEYKEWLSEVDDNKLAFCKVCKKSFKLSNMAEDTIKSHAGSDRHKTFMKEKSEVRSDLEKGIIFQVVDLENSMFSGHERPGKSWNLFSKKL